MLVVIFDLITPLKFPATFYIDVHYALFLSL